MLEVAIVRVFRGRETGGLVLGRVGRVVFGVRVWVRGGRAGLPAIGRADRWALGGRGVGRGLLGRWLRGC